MALVSFQAPAPRVHCTRQSSSRHSPFFLFRALQAAGIHHRLRQCHRGTWAISFHPGISRKSLTLCCSFSRKPYQTPFICPFFLQLTCLRLLDVSDNRLTSLASISTQSRSDRPPGPCHQSSSTRKHFAYRLRSIPLAASFLRLAQPSSLSDYALYAPLQIEFRPLTVL